ncbi:MAG: hypothetical protein JRF33_17880 [Deltaproteobacteria bacterium]|nr:hypothetical protein [Deltaproteobacteria bacterium]
MTNRRTPLLSLFSTFILLFILGPLGCIRSGYEQDEPDAGQIEAPFVFHGVSGAFVLEDSVVIVWSPATGGNGSEIYLVYRADESGTQDFSTPIAELPVGSILFQDFEPNNHPGSDWFYVVRTELEGEEEQNTREVTAHIADKPTATLQFSGLSHAIYASGSVSLFWAEAGGVDPADVSYRVFRSDTSGDFDFMTPQLDLPAGSVGCVDTNLPDHTEGTDYFYIVRAVYQGVEDGNTRQSGVTVLAEGHNVQSCPQGMVNVDQMFCIDIDQHSAAPWITGVETCHAEGKELCTWVRWHTACVTVGASLNDMTDTYEWVQDSYSASDSIKAGNGSCEYMSSHTRADPYDFRCCL